MTPSTTDLNDRARASHLAGIERKLQGFLTDIQQRTGIPGLSVALTMDGLRVRTAVGTASSGNDLPLSPSSRFQTGCITKMLTCLVVLELARERTVSLDAPLGEYLRELNDTPKGRNITLHHLAAHTSGYQGLNLANTESAYFYSWDKFIEFFRNTPQTFSPGAVFNYEHSECVILGEIVRRITGSTTERIARDLILDPLGLTLGTIKADVADPQVHVAHHAFEPNSAGYKTLRAVPYCDFWAQSLSDATISTSDLACLGETLIGMSPCRVAQHTIEEAQKPAVHIPLHIGGARKEQMPVAFGFGCAHYSGYLLGHNGSARGQTCGIRFDPTRRMVIVVALNSWQPYVRDLILNSVADEVRPPGERGEAPADEWSLEELEGDYAGCVQGVSLVARREDRQLVFNLTNQSTKTTSRMSLSHDNAGHLALQCDAPHLSAGFFREASSGAACIMVGLNAFRKIS